MSLLTIKRSRAPIAPAAVPLPRYVIWDGDMWFDPDDVLELGVLSGLAKGGECTILAAVTNSKFDYSAPCARAILNYSGWNSVPLGAYKGSAGVTNASSFAQTVASEFGQSGKTRADFSDAVTVLKAALASVPDKSVVYINGGFFTNLAAMWQDAQGQALLRAKVAVFYLPCGDYPVGAAEFNLAQEPISASYWFANHKEIPTYLSGVTTGGLTQVTPPGGWTDSVPYKRALTLFGQASRAGWTSICMLHACRGAASRLGTSAWGQNNTVDSSNGNNSLSTAAGRNCGFLTISTLAADRALINTDLNALLAAA